MSVVIFFIILLVLVLVHEFGHFFAAKKFGIRVDEFGFGFPPRLFGVKKGETEYTFNLFPIGGFVKIFGENPDSESLEGPDRGRSFVNKPKWQQAVVLVAGVFANFLLAFVLFTYGFMSGLPTSVESEYAKNNTIENASTVIVSVLPDSPAYAAGMRPGDKILSVASGAEKIEATTPDEVRSFIMSRQGETISIGYGRGFQKNINYAEMTPVVMEGGEPKVGISMDQIGTVSLPFGKAVVEGAKLTVSATAETAKGLWGLIRNVFIGQGSLEGVTGPVGLVGIVGDAYAFGLSYLLSFTALISVNLAIINLIPFPALDGGRLLFLIIEKIKGGRVNQQVFNMANMVGFAILLFFMLAVTYKDITTLF